MIKRYINKFLKIIFISFISKILFLYSVNAESLTEVAKKAVPNHPSIIAQKQLLKAAKIAKGSGEPNRDKVGSVSENDLRTIADIKMKDLNANTVEQAVEMIRGTCVSMGIEIKG